MWLVAGALSGSTCVIFIGGDTAVCDLHRSAHSTSGLQGAMGGNKQKRTESDLITVEDIVKHHWQEFGRSAAQMLPGCAGARRPLPQHLSVLCSAKRMYF